ncbi:hypothetical protein, partial [Bradyrhizobium sp. AS23.2]|uniref:hypothetical protein n=1 Tax=Bradyrhizobium sp. AS23.2 TaxID=1680155 RepID=UPI0014307135
FFIACHIRKSSRATANRRLEDLHRRHHDASASFTAGDFATAETFIALRKTPAARAQMQSPGKTALHTADSQRRSYPVKRDSKNDVWIITYPHSEAKHLENDLARDVREGFVKYFWLLLVNCHTARLVFESVHGFKNLLSSLCTSRARR